MWKLMFFLSFVLSFETSYFEKKRNKFLKNSADKKKQKQKLGIKFKGY